jgi:hypothetical protein
VSFYCVGLNTELEIDHYTNSPKVSYTLVQEEVDEGVLGRRRVWLAVVAVKVGWREVKWMVAEGYAPTWVLFVGWAGGGIGVRRKLVIGEKALRGFRGAGLKTGLHAGVTTTCKFL